MHYSAGKHVLLLSTWGSQPSSGARFLSCFSANNVYVILFFKNVTGRGINRHSDKIPGWRHVVLNSSVDHIIHINSHLTSCINKSWKTDQVLVSYDKWVLWVPGHTTIFTLCCSLHPNYFCSFEHRRRDTTESSREALPWGLRGNGQSSFWKLFRNAERPTPQSSNSYLLLGWAFHEEMLYAFAFAGASLKQIKPSSLGFLSHLCIRMSYEAMFYTCSCVNSKAF